MYGPDKDERQLQRERENTERYEYAILQAAATLYAIRDERGFHRRSEQEAVRDARRLLTEIRNTGKEF